MKIFFLPGWAGGGEDFSALMELLPASIRKECLYEAPLSAQFSEELTFDSVIQTLATRINQSTEEFYLCGYSMGGRLSLALIPFIKNNPKFKGLILLSAGLGVESEEEKNIRAQNDQAWSELLCAKPEEFWLRWYEQGIFQSLKNLPAAKMQAWLAKRKALNTRNLALDLDLYGHSRHPFLLPLAQELAPKPLLYLSGVLDTKYGQIGARLKSSIREITVLNIPGAGHVLPLEAPVLVAQAIMEWLH